MVVEMGGSGVVEEGREEWREGGRNERRGLRTLPQQVAKLLVIL